MRSTSLESKEFYIWLSNYADKITPVLANAISKILVYADGVDEKNKSITYRLLKSNVILTLEEFEPLLRIQTSNFLSYNSIK